ncbi:MAG: PAS domain S-box protein [Cryomorphaceae bacterium]|nr:PAS domain S-box protein [Cryomorphaceae bacterium]
MKRTLLMVAMLLSIHLAAQNVRGRIVDGVIGNAFIGDIVVTESSRGFTTFLTISASLVGVLISFLAGYYLSKKRHISSYKNDKKAAKTSELELALDYETEKRKELESLLISHESAQKQTIDKIVKDLAYSQIILENVINTALDAVVTANGQSIVIEWNRQAEIIFGYSKDEAIGKTLSELIIPQRHSSAHHEGVKHYHATRKGPALNQQIEIQAVRKDGVEIDISLYITPIHVGEEVFFSSFIRDITESKALAKRLDQERLLNESILNALPINITLKNRDLTYVFANKFLCESLKIEEVDIIGKTDFHIHPEGLAKKLEAEDLRIWETEQVTLEEEKYLLDGKDVYLLSGKYLVHTNVQDNADRYLLSFSFDITKQKRSEEKLIEALAAKDSFLSTMSHEIRTPLHSIIAISEILQNDNTLQHDEKSELVGTLNVSSRHLLALINEILDFSKINSGKFELEKEAFDLNLLLTDIRKKCQTQKTDKIEFHFIQTHSITHKVLGDSLRLTQVLYNLISNAFKFTTQGSVTLQVECEKESEERMHFTFSVADTGIGIKPENIALINEAFTQENSSISRKFGGTGLGLSIVSSLLGLCGSKLIIESKENEGSTFSFKMPFDLGEAINSDVENRNLDENLNFTGFSMLYVEDMLPNQLVMQGMIKNWGIDLTIADSAKMAFELLEQKQFHIILMDIQMPEIDGVEALKIIRKTESINQFVPIIAFTANAEKNEVDTFRKMGFAEVLTKPISPQKFKMFLKDFFEL